MLGFIISLLLCIFWFTYVILYFKKDEFIEFFGYRVNTQKRFPLITLQLLFALIGLLIITTVFVYTDMYYHFQTKDPGTVKITEPLHEYGFGESKRLLIFNFDVKEIDMTDKIFAMMSYGENGTLVNQTVGIEIKGSGIEKRTKLNYAFEIWKPDTDDIPCTSPETCDDDKAELFQWGEKYEDWVLRGGFFEPTLVRDAAATQMKDLKDGIMDSKLVEVLFFNNNIYTYEGVYLLFPAIQRRLIEKRLDLNNNGKKEDCEDNPTQADIDGTLLIGEYTNPSKGRKQPCSEEGINNLKVKMRYPKCDIGPCYHDRIQQVFSVLTSQNKSIVPLNLQSFMYTFFAETLLMNGDFPVSSQYFFLNPDTQILNSGPRWDYDFITWRFQAFDTWDFHITYDTKPADIWVKLGFHREFISLLNSYRKNITEQNMNVMMNIISERRSQFSNGYFDKNIRRWGGYNVRPVSFSKEINLILSLTKKTMAEELDFIEERLLERGQWMINNPIVDFEFYYGNSHIINTILFYSDYSLFLWLIFLLIPIFIIFLLKYGIAKCYKNKSLL